MRLLDFNSLVSSYYTKMGEFMFCTLFTDLDWHSLLMNLH